MGPAGRCAGARTGAQLADAIWAAVQSKQQHYPSAQREQLLLALDAIRSPAYVDDAVVAAFLAEHRAAAEEVGYQAIWLVGPTAELAHQLC